MIDTCQYTRDLPDLSGKQSMVNIHEWLFLKKGAGKELLHGADILLPGKMECNRFDGFTLQQA